MVVLRTGFQIKNRLPGNEFLPFITTATEIKVLIPVEKASVSELATENPKLTRLAALAGFINRRHVVAQGECLDCIFNPCIFRPSEFAPRQRVQASVSAHVARLEDVPHLKSTHASKS